MSVDISKYRQWISEFRYPGKKEARFGVLYVEPGTPHKQIKKDMIKKIEEHLPAGFELVWTLPGQMWSQTYLKPEDLDQTND